MHWLASILVAFGILVMASEPSHATLFSGKWVPAEGATAEYCLDGACARYPVDASIGYGPPPSPESLLNGNLTIGFRPLGFESFDVIIGMTVGADSIAAGVQTIRGSFPGFEDFDLTIRIESDRSLRLDGFLHIDHAVGVFDARFQDALFVPVPEPGSAWLVGAGLSILAMRSRGGRSDRSEYAGAGSVR